MGTVPKQLNLHEIARLAGTSKSTVSRVITRHPNVSEKTRKRVEEVIRASGFQPNIAARKLAGGKAGVIGVVLPWLESGFFAEVMRGIIEVSWWEHGDHLLSSFAHSIEDYINIWRGFSAGQQVDGVILVAPPLQLLKETREETATPTVLCACRGKGNSKGWASADSVTVNNDAGFTALLEYLLEEGHRDLVYLSGRTDTYDEAERMKVFKTFVRRHHLEKARVLEVEPTVDAGRAFIEKMAADGQNPLPETVVCFNDAQARGIVDFMHERGMQIPHPQFLTGCDDEIPSRYIGLTTLRVPMVEMGREAARQVYRRLQPNRSGDRPRHVTLDLPLVVRDLQPAGAISRT